MSIIRLSLFLSLSLLSVSGCSSDDSDSDDETGGTAGISASGATGGSSATGGSGGARPDGRYAGVVAWPCWRNSDNYTCSCYGLEAGESIQIGGSALSAVAACVNDDECYSFRDDQGDWVCACGRVAFLPDQTIGGDTQVVSTCPPI